MKALRIDVWSDIVCPWCYVGKRRLEAALSQFPHRNAVEVIWRAFELDPSAPAVRDESVPYVERLAQKYRTTVGQAQAMVQRMTEVAAADGLDFRFDRMRPGRTFDAHRLLHLAAERGLQDALKERLMRAYMTEGAAIGDAETLLRLASEAGLDSEEAKNVLATDAYSAEVRSEEEEAHDIGVTGVPFFVIAGRYAVSGAQPAESLLRAVTTAWNELSEVAGAAEGDTCGPEGCG
ncbi:MAG TPA: DsbA family oxidoreductase [Polyangiaceae bacterium]|nr:DsbA family oxidoreductase [Polyangiaceae bacterium]